MINILDKNTILECKICGKTFTQLEHHNFHIKKYHNMTVNDYVLKYYLNDIHPVCECGCGQEVKMYGFKYNNYITGHGGRGKHPITWQNKYSKDSQEYKDIIDKISKSVSEHAKNNPKEISEEQKKKLSISQTEWMKNNPDKVIERTEKMVETKRRQIDEGTLSEHHYTKTKSEEEVKEIYKRITEKTQKTKQELKDKGLYFAPWNTDFTKFTHPGLAKCSFENHYRFNPNKHEYEYSDLFYNKKYRKLLLEHQNNKCFLCDENHILCLHHIDLNKQNNEYNNLIYLCRKCHITLHSTKNYDMVNFKKQVQEFKDKNNIN